MTTMTAQEIAQNWANKLGASGDKIKAGVAKVTESPMAKAAARQDAWVAGVQRAREQGTYAAALNRVPLQAWKDAMINKGVNRIGSGATAAIPKFAAFMGPFMQHIQAGLNTLASQPRGDLSQNIGRMVTMVQHLATFKQS